MAVRAGAAAATAVQDDEPDEEPLLSARCFEGRRPRRPRNESRRTTSGLMPSRKHFWKRQYWQRLRRRLSIGQFRSPTHTYLAFFCTVRLKKPLQPSHVRTP